MSALIDVVNKYLESDSVTLPVFNPSAARIQQELAKKEPSISAIEKIITTDQSLSTQVIKTANSTFYRGLAKVSTVRNAIMRLGMKEIAQIVLMSTTRNTFKCNDKLINLIMRRLWQHSVGCAYGAVWLSKRHNYGIEQSQAFFGGLFHDVGKLFILMVIEHVKQQNKQVKITPNLMLEAMDSLHTSQGYKLLEHWNVPNQFSVIARDHHTQEVDSANGLMLLVRMADMVCSKLGISTRPPKDILLPATPEATLLNLSEVDIAELEIFLEDSRALTS